MNKYLQDSKTAVETIKKFRNKILTRLAWLEANIWAVWSGTDELGKMIKEETFLIKLDHNKKYNPQKNL